MLSVEPSLFSNVITSVQRTSSLTGGSISGLPGGVVIEGLKGVTSFGSDVAEAQKEFELGRVRSSLERIKQIEIQFNGIAGRWNSQVMGVISSARQGKQRLSQQKLNEIKAAQSKMQQLTGPATKAFRDLVSALEHAVTAEGRATQDESADPSNKEPEDVATESNGNESEPATVPAKEPKEETPDLNLLGSFMTNYRFGEKLQLRKGEDEKTRIVPQLECEKFYFMAGLEPPGVVRIRKIERSSLVVFDTQRSSELAINSVKLRELIRRGIWILRAK